MKYCGTIVIMDDEGNQVFERELNEDEIVEALIAAIPDAEVERDEALPVSDSGSAWKPSGRKCGSCGEVGHSARTCSREPLEDTHRSQGHSCCGSKGSRHMKTCEFKGTELHGQSKNRRTVDNRHPFSEPTYSVVKTLLEKEDRTVDEISAEKGLELDEVRRVNLSNDFEDYLAIA